MAVCFADVGAGTDVAVRQSAGAIHEEIFSRQQPQSRPQRTKPLHVLLAGGGRGRRDPRARRASNSRTEAVVRSPNIGIVDVGLQTEQPLRSDPPIVAQLAAADDTVRVSFQARWYRAGTARPQICSAQSVVGAAVRTAQIDSVRIAVAAIKPEIKSRPAVAGLHSGRRRAR